MMMLEDAQAIRLINHYQGGFPLESRPFARIASDLDITHQKVLHVIQSLLEGGWINRFGPLFDAQQLGGAVTLAALSVPEERFEEVTRCVNQFVEVAHNYRREHLLNMWFVVSCDSQQRLQQVLELIQHDTGLQVYNCPKLKEYYVGLQFVIDEQGPVSTIPVEHAQKNREPGPAQGRLDSVDRNIIRVCQNGLALLSRPYLQIAEQLKMTESEVLKRLQLMLDRGIIRRIGLVPNHYKLGFRGNGMVVWNVDDEQVDEIGQLLGSQSYVSHCYQRPRHLPFWPYNLFTMVHGRDKHEVSVKVKALEELLLAQHFEHEILLSSAILKKTGLRLAAA